MRTPEITGVADDEPFAEAPNLAQAIQPVVDGRHRLAVGPIVDDGDAVRENAQRLQVLGHTIADRNVHRRPLQRIVTQPARKPPERSVKAAHTQSRSDLREYVLQPVHDQCPAQPRQRSHDDRKHGRVGIDDHYVTRPRDADDRDGRTHGVRQVIQRAPSQRSTAEAGRPDPANDDTAFRLVRRQQRARVIVVLAAGDDHRFVTDLTETKC